MRLLVFILSLGFFGFAFASSTPKESQAVLTLKKMFSQMVEKKDLTKIPVFYAKNFVMMSNGVSIPYKQYYQDHIKPYQSADTFKVSYDHKSLFGVGNRVAARVVVTITKPNKTASKVVLMLIGVYNKKYQFTKMWVMNRPNTHHVLPANLEIKQA